MIQNRKKIFKSAVVVLIVVLVIFSAFFFFKAAFPSHKIDNPSSYNTQIHIFINQNDSIINRLQEDVERLSSIIENMRTDTVVIEMRKPSVSD